MSQNLPSLLAMHSLQNRIMDWRTRSNTPGFSWITAAAQTILAARSILESTGIAYTTFFNALQRKNIHAA